jgi:hypothetical protein
VAIAFDASANGQTNFSATLTFAHTCAGSDRALFVAVCANNNRTISGVTYSGVAMTAVETGSAFIRLYALAAPATGANNVVVTLDAPDVCVGISASYTGVDQSTPYDGVQASAAGDGAPTLTVTSATGNLVVGMSGYIDGNGQTVQAAGAGQTSRGTLEETGHYDALSDEPGAASTTFSYTRSGAFYYAQRIVAVNVIAAGAAGPTIDTQPQADTVLINGDPTRASASFTVAASGTGTVDVTAEIENGVGSGVYVTLANGSGATWAGLTGTGSGSAGTTLTGTFTVKTLTGRRIRFACEDDNGTTYSDAVALTVYTGPTISKTSGTTNGSGVDTLTVESDYPNADGEFTVVTATAGAVSKQVSLHFEAP